jgi:ubiquinone/menaquinone biosynthesis C-methylase UbiE
MPALPPYFDALIAARRAGQVGRHVHLGYWDALPALAVPPAGGGEFEAAQARLTERIIGLAATRSGDAVLDIACGFGGTLAALDERFADLRLTGLNIDRRQLALCRGAVRRPGNTLSLVAADACALPFPPAVFDRVFCVEAMFHFASRRRFLTEAARVLRPGGRLVVCDILLRQPQSSAPWDAATIAAIIRRDYGPWPAPWVAVADILAWAEEAGLEPVEVQDGSAATLPSYRFVAPARAVAARQASAGEVFRWLHMRGWLTYPALSFRCR